MLQEYRRQDRARQTRNASAPQTLFDAQITPTINKTGESTWEPAKGVQSAGWKRPSGFPDYWHDPTPPQKEIT